ncbi:hypothetical protein PSTG_05653 [Puccinia striiformis f. sp. tritici PST-78]|uniref:Uncharacterized protein n=1 Tax=Puccinia striiformis f. sp. tritici PST-78 TaxID=1165861 RepID=A0A0L0VPV6_9BASI|nr:hypothetical protein PSTG_05653 [Puccinia striiformis f. sp. tritici PST-78]
MFRASSESRVAEDAASAAREAHGVNGAAPALVHQGHIPVGQPLGHAGQALGAGPADTTIREPSKYSLMKMRFREMWKSMKMKLKKMFDFSWTRRMFDFSWTRRQWHRVLSDDDELVYHHPYVPLHQQHPYGPPVQMHGHPYASPGYAVPYVSSSAPHWIETPGHQVYEELSATRVGTWLPHDKTIAAEGLPNYFRTSGYIVQDENKLYRVLAYIKHKDQNKYPLVREEIKESARHNLGQSLVHTTEVRRKMSQLTSHLFEHGVEGGLDDIDAFARRNNYNIAVVYQRGEISHAEYFAHRPLSPYSEGIIMKDGDFELFSAAFAHWLNMQPYQLHKPNSGRAHQFEQTLPNHAKKFFMLS